MNLEMERAAVVIGISNRIRVVNRQIRAAIASGEAPDHRYSEELRSLTIQLESYDNGHGGLMVEEATPLET